MAANFFFDNLLNFAERLTFVAVVDEFFVLIAGFPDRRVTLRIIEGKVKVDRSGSQIFEELPSILDFPSILIVLGLKKSQSNTLGNILWIVIGIRDFRNADREIITRRNCVSRASGRADIEENFSCFEKIRICCRSYPLCRRLCYHSQPSNPLQRPLPECC